MHIPGAFCFLLCGLSEKFLHGSRGLSALPARNKGAKSQLNRFAELQFAFNEPAARTAQAMIDMQVAPPHPLPLRHFLEHGMGTELELPCARTMFRGTNSRGKRPGVHNELRKLRRSCFSCGDNSLNSSAGLAASPLWRSTAFSSDSDF